MTIQAMRKARRPGRSNCSLARARMSEPMTTPILATAIAQSIHPRGDLFESALAGSALGGAGETRSVMGDLPPRAALAQQGPVFACLPASDRDCAQQRTNGESPEVRASSR